MPRWVLYVVVIFVALSWIPFALIARERSTKHPYTRMLILPDMVKQQKYKAQRTNALFADTRADRRAVAGTVAHGQMKDDDGFYLGKVGGQWITAMPIEVTDVGMRRGQQRYNIYCAPCHGLTGAGDGMVAKRADFLAEGTWTPPSSMQDPTVRSRPVGHLFNTITNGIRNMPAYGSQIPEADRWAIVAYVRALQLSQHAPASEVPAEIRSGLR
jgi:mono/diheme cytochrome c family protein